MEIKGGAKYALIEVKYGGMQTSSYRTLEELISGILSSNGEEFPVKVRDEIIPRIISEYEAEDLENEDNLEYELAIESHGDEDAMY